MIRESSVICCYRIKDTSKYAYRCLLNMMRTNNRTYTLRNICVFISQLSSEAIISTISLYFQQWYRLLQNQDIDVELHETRSSRHHIIVTNYH